MTPTTRRAFLELIAALDDRSRLASFLRVGFYHLCFLVDDLGMARHELSTRKFVALPPFASEAFGGRFCQFFFTPHRHLIELAEMSVSDFGDFFGTNVAGVRRAAPPRASDHRSDDGSGARRRRLRRR